MGLRARRWGQESHTGKGHQSRGPFVQRWGSWYLWSQRKEDGFAGFTAGQGYSGYYL